MRLFELLSVAQPDSILRDDGTIFSFESEDPAVFSVDPSTEIRGIFVDSFLPLSKT